MDLMTQTLDLTNDAERGIDVGADWAFAFTVAGSVVTVITDARMEIRTHPSLSSPIIASFYSDATGTGGLTVSGLTVTVELPASVTDDVSFTYTGRAKYDLFITYDGGKEIKLLRGSVDVNPRVTQHD